MMASALIERTLAGHGLPVRNGVFVAVVGASGAGKDSVIGYARDRFAGDPGVTFVRRIITRPNDGMSEDHDTLAAAAFVKAEADGAFCLSWQAHGLRYGLPAELLSIIDTGRVAVANVSRSALSPLKERFANVAVVEIVASREILAKRLAARGRESREEVLARLARQATFDVEAVGGTKIDNSDALEIAGQRFVETIRKAVAFADISGSVE